MVLPLLSESQLPPLPPADLIARVVPAFGPDDINGARNAFHVAAHESVRSLERALSAVGRELTDFNRILDFGCGPGRLMRHLGPLSEGAELHGVDVDAAMISWCEENIPFAGFVTAAHAPPLPYDEDYFDLIFNHSVFTHLDEQRQDLWLGELRRLLKPGGIALLTVHSTRQWNAALRDIGGAGEDVEEYRRRLERDGILFVADDAFVGTTHPDWYHTTFHAPWYVYEHWTRFLAIRAYIHEGSDTQDMVVLERSVADRLAHPIGHGLAPAPAPYPTRRTTASLQLARSALRGAARRALSSRAAAEPLPPAEPDPSAEPAVDQGVTRALITMRAAMYQQGERISMVDQELRREIEELRRATGVGPEGSDGGHAE